MTQLSYFYIFIQRIKKILIPRDIYIKALFTITKIWKKLKNI